MNKYKKHSRLKEEIFLLSQMFLIVKFGIEANNLLPLDNLSKEIEDSIKDRIQTFSDKDYRKWQSIIAKTNTACGIIEMYKDGKSSHKLVLILYKVMLQLKIEGYKIEEDIEDFMEQLLEVENQQEMEDQDWTKLKKSADKQANRILRSARDIGMFVI